MRALLFSLFRLCCGWYNVYRDHSGPCIRSSTRTKPFHNGEWCTIWWSVIRWRKIARWPPITYYGGHLATLTSCGGPDCPCKIEGSGCAYLIFIKHRIKTVHMICSVWMKKYGYIQQFCFLYCTKVTLRIISYYTIATQGKKLKYFKVVVKGYPIGLTYGRAFKLGAKTTIGENFDKPITGGWPWHIRHFSLRQLKDLLVIFCCHSQKEHSFIYLPVLH